MEPPASAAGVVMLLHKGRQLVIALGQLAAISLSDYLCCTVGRAATRATRKRAEPLS